MFERSNAIDNVTPAQAGVQERPGEHWIPACAGMTESVPWFDWPFDRQ